MCANIKDRLEHIQYSLNIHDYYIKYEMFNVY